MNLHRFFYFGALLLLCALITSCDPEKEKVGWTPNEPEEENGPVKLTTDPDKTFVHPGLLHTQEDFIRMSTNVTAAAEPWVSGWNTLVHNSNSVSGYQPHPVVKLIRGGSSREEPEADNYGAAFRDVAAAYQNALRWKVSGDTQHAETAIDILNAWANTCTEISGNSNKALAAGIYGYQFANVAEIMRDYEGWTPTDFSAFKQWMMEVWYPVSDEFLVTHYNTCSSHYWANWDLANLANVMAIGVLTDNAELYNQAIEYLMKGEGNGNLDLAIYFIHDEGELGQMQESGRDQGHTLLCIGLLGVLAEMAWNQGDDVYGYDDNRILKGAEYVAKYNFTNLGAPFEPYDNCNGVDHTEVSPDGAGEHRPIWARIYNHYVKRQGLSATYAELAVNIHTPEGGGGDYSPNSGGYDNLGFGTLVYSRD